MLRKILKWMGIIILLLIAGFTVAVMARQHLTYDAPYPNIKASSDSALIAKGKHIVMGPGHCAGCHSPVDNIDSITALGMDVPLIGGRAFHLPFGSFYTRNLTPDMKTGIGELSDGEIARVLRYGVKPNGEAVLPFMPFQEMSDEDLAAVISYLRTLKPVKNEVPDHDYNLMGKVIKAFMIKPVGPAGRVPVSVKEDSTAKYGKHLVMAVANCNECHTKRNGIGEYVGQPMAGGNEFREEGKPTLITPNLTPDPSSRIFNWTEQTFIQRFRMGRVIKHSHMPWEAYGRMTDMELKAIWNYLQTLKPVKTTGY